MSTNRGNLKPAHRGYQYQDIATAYMLVRSLVDNYDEVIVDKKQVDGDKIDDLEVKIQGKRIRRQFKSSDNKQRYFSLKDFANKSSILPFDQLVLTHVRDQGIPVSEYRLCATWCTPHKDDEAHKYLVQSADESTFLLAKTNCYRLNAKLIWPEKEPPVWTVLEPFTKTNAEFNRKDFIAFCDKFVIELDLPFASLDLTSPTEFERELLSLLSERVGIGRYPNQDRQVADVAALAISLATLARTKEDKLSPNDVEHNLGIRTDFGRVAQSFPVDNSVFYDRPVFRNDLMKKISVGGVHLILAEPGAGKSWELTRLADELKQLKFIVARHYCYLEPGDELVERRITTDVFFGNLLAEIHDAFSNETIRPISQYSAGLKELEKTLKEIPIYDFSVILIIDGLDHIARVRSSSNALSDNETDIVEQLATLNIPENVSIVIGSQPGDHLEPLRNRPQDDLTEYKLPSWSDNEIIQLAELYGVQQALESFLDIDQIAKLLSKFTISAGGNPLYTHYLSTSLMKGIQDGSITSPQDWLSSYPVLKGNISTYYEHLYHNASQQAQAIADLFGVIDFSVTQSDLESIVPILRSWLPSAISVLTPILTTETTGQGGLRIFHESFRRFMLDELKLQGRQLTDVLNPVIDWLEKLGFYKSTKSYRFLLPALRRANRGDEVLEQVNSMFIAESLYYAYPQDAIQKNLALAADIAGKTQNWPILVRCNELRRTLLTSFDNEEEELPGEYWLTYIALFGADALSERLLFDGKPVLSKSNGLKICSMIDHAGGIAPWKEYFDIPYERSNVPLSEALIIIHGRLRMRHYWKIARRLYPHVFGASDKLNISFIRKLSTLLTRMISPGFVEKIALRSRVTRKGKMRLSDRAATALRLGVADYYQNKNDIFQQVIFANKAIKIADSLALTLDCFSLHASVTNASQYTYNPDNINISTEGDSHISNDYSIRTWVNEIRYIAIFVKDNEILDSQLERVEGIGWYRCWLKYVIELAKAQAAQVQGQSYDIREVFNELLHDTHPFRGNPRAMDLYSVEGLIKETFQLGLSLIITKKEWKNVLEILSNVCSKTSSRLDREDGGPFNIGTFLEILIPHAQHPISKQPVQEMIFEQIKRLDEIGSYYSTHAEYTMKLARTQAISGDFLNAKITWKKAVLFLTGYGFRKDITLFDIVDTVPALKGISQDIALQALDDLQPLVHAVIRHTDGRETKHIPSAWFDSLLKTCPIIAIKLLSRTVLEDQCIENWVTIRAFKSVLNHIKDMANPMIVNALWQTLLLEIEYEGNAEKVIKERIISIDNLAKKHPKDAYIRLGRLVTEVENDTKRYRKEGVIALQKLISESYFSTSYNYQTDKVETRHVQKKSYSTLNKNKTIIPNLYFPIFPKNASLVEIFSSLRSIERKSDSDKYKGNIAHTLSYMLGEMVDNGQEELAFRIIYFYVREAGFMWSSEPIHELAKALENAKYKRLATISYALAYIYSRGGGGWFSIGGKEHSHTLNKAINIDRDLALQTVANDIAYRLRDMEYGAGISKNLINRTAEWGESKIAHAAWKEAFNIISPRLLLAPEQGYFSKLDLQDSISWSINEGLVSMLLVRIAEPRLTRKLDALEGIVRIIKHYPESIPAPLDWWLSRDTFISSILLVLEILLNIEEEPYPITCALEERLRGYAHCSSWGVNKLSRLLLDRARLLVPNKVQSHAIDTSIIDNVSLTQNQLQGLLSIDIGNQLESFKVVWPELNEKVAKFIHVQIDKNEIQKDRIRETFELSHGRRGESYPSTPVLRWESELFISTLHDLLTELPTQLWKKGGWSEELEDTLLMESIPDTAIHLANSASRTSRPNYSKPASLASGQNSPMIIDDATSEYNGWTCLAVHETEYIKNSDDSFSPPTEIASVFASVISIPIGDTIPLNAFPFNKGSKDGWWIKEYDPLSVNRGLSRKIVGLNRVTDWLGDLFILIPPSTIHNFIELKTPTYGEPFVWTDQHSNPAVVMRNWRVRSEDITDCEPVSLKGCDLIIRPDIANYLERCSVGTLKELRIVNRERIT